MKISFSQSNLFMALAVMLILIGLCSLQFWFGGVWGDLTKSDTKIYLEAEFHEYSQKL